MLVNELLTSFKHQSVASYRQPFYKNIHNIIMFTVVDTTLGKKHKETMEDFQL